MHVFETEVDDVGGDDCSRRGSTAATPVQKPPSYKPPVVTVPAPPPITASLPSLATLPTTTTFHFQPTATITTLAETSIIKAESIPVIDLSLINSHDYDNVSVLETGRRSLIF